MTKPILYLMLLTGGALAAGAGVVTYSEWQTARQSAASIAPTKPAERTIAAGEVAPAEAEPQPSPEESLAVPQPAAPAAGPPQQPAPSEREVAALPQPAAPAGEPAADAVAPQAPAAEPGAPASPESPPSSAEPDEPAMPNRQPMAEPTEPAAPPSPPDAVEPGAPATASGAPAEPVEAPAADRPEPAPQPQERAALAPEQPAAAPPAPVEAAEEAAPAAPSFDIVRVEPTGEAVIAGRAPRGSRVQVLSNDEVVAETSADEAGNWVALPERPLRPGDHDLTLRAVDEAGGAAQSDQHVAVAVPDAPGEEVVAVLAAPGQPSEILAAPGGQEPRATGEPPQKLEAMATAGEVAERRPPVLSVDAVEAEGRTMFIAGAGDPGALVRVYVDGELLGEAEAGTGGRWLVEATRPLEEGEVTVRADQLKTGTAQVEARAEVPFVRRLDMAALVPAARAGSGAGDSAEGEELPQPGAVIIRRGDNLWTISRRTYGRGVRYTTIYQANHEQIRDPHWIYPGQVFMLPTGDRAWSER
jgi:nucleoid-associated protein YgaU